MTTDPDLLEEYRLTILAKQFAHPRSQQRMIGPSGLGTPCGRKLAYGIAQHPKVNDQAPSWRATVGVAAHAWLEGAFGSVTLPDGAPRYLVEQRVTVGQIGGADVTGTVDLYDRAAQAVIDHKVVGPSSLKAKKANGVGETYRAQRHLYGLGIAAAGHPVQQVGNLILPAAGDLHEAHLDIEDFDPDYARDVLARADRLAGALAVLPLELVLDAQPAVDDFCRSCDWLRRGSTNLRDGCPGVAPKAQQPALTLVNADNTNAAAAARK